MSSPQTARIPASTWGALGVSILSILVLYGGVPYTTTNASSETIPLFRLLWMIWRESPDWQHGMIVPFISLALVWYQRERFKELPVAGAQGGLWFLLFSLFCYWLAFKGDLKPVAFLSIQLLIGSFIVWFLGWNWFRALLFPWLFLVFTWPFGFLDGMVALPLRHIMSGFSSGFLNAIGIPTMTVGTALVSAPDYLLGLSAGQRFQLDVANPCSGIRSLFALGMIAALYGYLSLPKTWQRTVLFLCAAPLAVFGNFVRIAMLTFGTLLFGNRFAIGSNEEPSFYHELSGYVVFVVALAGIVGISWLLALDGKAVTDRFRHWLKTPSTPTGTSRNNDLF